MTCTKSMNFIPEDKRPTSSKPGKPGTINVWDLTADAWRSFRYDRIQSVETPEFIGSEGVNSR
jgi:hypothetical protein